MFSWTVSNQKNRGPMWYIGAIIIILVLVIYGIISSLYLLSVVSVLFAGVFLLIENNSLPLTTFAINEKFLFIDNTEYSWTLFQSFAFAEIGEKKILKLFPVKKFSPTFEIPLADEINLVELRNFLLQFLEENPDARVGNFETLAELTKI